MIEILDYQETPLGLLCLRRRELLSRPGIVVTEVTLDHCFLMSSYHTESERALTTRALELHEGGKGLNVLVGGLGLGYTAIEALDDSNVTSVEVVEYLPQVIEWIEKDWIPDAQRLREDERLKVTLGDVYARLLGPADESNLFDAILIDVDHAPDEMLVSANAPFYTREGLLTAKSHLRPGGILGVWSTFENDDFLNLMKSVFEEVTIDTISWWNDLVDIQKEDTLFFARS